MGLLFRTSQARNRRAHKGGLSVSFVVDSFAKEDGSKEAFDVFEPSCISGGLRARPMSRRLGECKKTPLLHGDERSGATGTLSCHDVASSYSR